jgi:hypothetical protein
MHYSPEYKICMNRCTATTLPPIDPVVDRCSFIERKCRCLNTNGNCFWCSEQLTAAGAAFEHGRCVRATSNHTCHVRGLTATRVDPACTPDTDPHTDPAPTRPTKPLPADVRKCLFDARCVDKIRLNRDIDAARLLSTTAARNHVFHVLEPIETPTTDVPAKVRLTIEILPPNPPTVDLQAICELIRTHTFNLVGVDSTRWLGCQTIATQSPKRQAGSQTNTYIVDMTYSSAPAAILSIALVFIAFLVQL